MNWLPSQFLLLKSFFFFLDLVFQFVFSLFTSNWFPNYKNIQDKSRSHALQGGYGSVGPIRRVRHKFGTQFSTRNPAYTPLSLNGPSQKETSDVHEGFLPAVTKSLEPDGNSSIHKFFSKDNKPQGTETGVPTVHMHTSLMARKILEHIDRNPATPREKSAELRLATKWKNPESTVDVNTVLSNENTGFLKSKDVGPDKYNWLDGNKSNLRNEDQGNSLVGRESTDKSTNVNNVTPLASGMNIGSSFLRTGNDAWTSQNLNGSQNFPIKSTEEVHNQSHGHINLCHVFHFLPLGI